MSFEYEDQSDDDGYLYKEQEAHDEERPGENGEDLSNENEHEAVLNGSPGSSGAQATKLKDESVELSRGTTAAQAAPDDIPTAKSRSKSGSLGSSGDASGRNSEVVEADQTSLGKKGRGREDGVSTSQPAKGSQKPLENDRDDPPEVSTSGGALGQDEEDMRDSSVDPAMVHTAITEKDNPFMQLPDDEGAGAVDNCSPSSSRPLVNPNNVYEDDVDDILPLKHGSAGNNHTSSGEDSIDVRRRSSAGTIQRKSTVEENSESGKVQILEANKLSEGQGRTYIAYTIKYKGLIVRRRYSDFESLRNVLVKLFPLSLIPPIPEKQSIKTYGKAIATSKPSYLLPSEGTGSVDLSLSVINGSVNNNDERLIRHRIRMLTGFLNKLLQNAEITKTSIISDFLDPNNSNWSDFIASSATFSSLPKSPLQCNPLDPTTTTRIHACLPIPYSSSQSLLHKDGTAPSTETKDGFQVIEKDYKRYESILNDGFYKYSRRITKNMYDLKHCMKDLGEAYAQFAAAQGRGADLAEAFSHISDAFEESAVQLESTVGRFYYNVNEPLSECVHMAGSARDLIKFRKMKRIQLEMIRKALLSKRAQLEKLEEHEKEMKKVEADINQEMSRSQRVNLEHPHPKTYSGKLLNKFNKLASMVKDTVNYQDPDLETSMATLKVDTRQLEESLEVSEGDMKVITSVIRDQKLEEFSKEREEDISEILKNYSKYLREYAQRNLEIWREVKSTQT